MFKTLRQLFLLAVIFFGWSVEGGEVLKTKDVPAIMQQIFDQHVSQKSMTASTLKNSFMVYINQFDPHKTYLLESEVAPYRDISESAVNRTLQQYQSENFAAFDSLNNTIQKAIFRTRAIRAELEKNAKPLFLMVATGRRFGSDSGKGFATTPDMLKERVQGEILSYIQEMQAKFGMAQVLENQAHVLAQFEKMAQEKENHYLYLDDSGKMISAVEAENLFALHLLKAMSGSLDAHTAFYDTSEASDLKMKLQKKTEGLGLILEERPDGKVQIIDFVPGSAALSSQQIQRNDILLSVDGQEVQDKTLVDVMELLKRADQPQVHLLLQRGGGVPFDVNLTRSEISLDADRAKTAFQKVDGGIIGVITLNSFYQNEDNITSEQDVKNAIRRLQHKGNLKGLILDLRDNSGGFLMQAVKTAGLFMASGVVVVSKYFNGEEHIFRDIDSTKYYEGPLIILTSRATASAAEIVTQALQDYGIALVVGDKETYGKGTIQNQTVTKAEGASLFKVTVGRYYTPSGRTPQLNGVKADIFVPGAYNYERIGEKFLSSTIPADTIQENFNDRLADLSALQKQWFMRHYMPTLEHRHTRWKVMLGQLKERSSQRIAQNKGYQKFIRELQGSRGVTETVDYQLMEAINIAKDMIFLSSPNVAQEAISGGIPALPK